MLIGSEEHDGCKMLEVTCIILPRQFASLDCWTADATSFIGSVVLGVNDSEHGVEIAG
jgi:hypothetical protein